MSEERMNESDRKKLALSKIILIVLAIVSLAVVVWFGWILPERGNDNVRSFDACVSGNNRVEESYPEVCVTDDGKRFVNPDHDPDNAN